MNDKYCFQTALYICGASKNRLFSIIYVVVISLEISSFGTPYSWFKGTITVFNIQQQTNQINYSINRGSRSEPMSNFNCTK